LLVIDGEEIHLDQPSRYRNFFAQVTCGRERRGHVARQSPGPACEQRRQIEVRLAMPLSEQNESRCARRFVGEGDWRTPTETPGRTSAGQSRATS